MSTAAEIAGHVAALAGCVVAALCTLAWWVVMIASAPNSTPRQLRRIVRMMWGGVVVGLAFTAGAIYLWSTGRPWQATGVGFAPLVIEFLLLVVAGARKG